MLEESVTILETWESELSLKAKSTQKKYREKFNLFLERWETTPGELYEARLGDIKSGDPLKFRRIEKMVEIQMSEMVKAGKSPSTAKQLKKAVNLFFEAINLPLKIRAKSTPNGDVVGQRMMRGDQQIELIENQNRLNRKRNTAILLVGKDSGLRVSDIQRLTLEAYEEAETILNEVGEPFKKFDPEITQKCKVVAHIHLGPESVKAIDEYLEERREKGLIADKPTLFINKSKKAFGGDSMGNMIAHQCTLLGAKFKKLSAHSLRKFHRTKLQKARMPDSWIDLLQGKKADTYSRPSEGGDPTETGDLTQAYIESYNELRIYGVPEELQAKEEELESLRAENLRLEELGKTAFALVEENKAVQLQLLERLEKLEQRLNDAEEKEV